MEAAPPHSRGTMMSRPARTHHQPAGLRMSTRAGAVPEEEGVVQAEPEAEAEKGRRVLRRGWCGVHAARRMRWRRSWRASMLISRR